MSECAIMKVPNNKIIGVRATIMTMILGQFNEPDEANTPRVFVPVAHLLIMVHKAALDTVAAAKLVVSRELEPDDHAPRIRAPFIAICPLISNIPGANASTMHEAITVPVIPVAAEPEDIHLPLLVVNRVVLEPVLQHPRNQYISRNLPRR
jgi:hypothetical protein